LIESKSIRGKKILITGASAGIGAQCAKIFAQHKADIGIHYRENRQKAEELAEEIRNEHVRVEIFKGDLLEKSVRGNIISDYVNTFGEIHVLVNNAGACYSYKHFADLDEDSWDKTISLNAKAPFFLSRYAFNYMKEQKWGRIINISTGSIKFAGANSLHYSASKSALETLTIGFAKEGAKYNILANCIRCGVIDTPMHTKIDGYNKELLKKRVEMIPLKRMGKPIDIARMVLYLASDSGDFITGETFSIDGGE